MKTERERSARKRVTHVARELEHLGKTLMADSVVVGKDWGRSVLEAAALLRSPEKASKETIRLAALGRVVERMPDGSSLIRDHKGIWLFHKHGAVGAGPTASSPKETLSGYFRSARLNRKGRK